MVVEAVVRNPSQMGIRAKYRAKTKKAHKSVAGSPQSPVLMRVSVKNEHEN
jgi:hypothetical protein